MGGITAFDEPLAHSGVEALVSVAIDRRIVEAVHCGKAVLEIAAAAHVAPATFAAGRGRGVRHRRSEEHTSELQSLMRISYAVLCLKKKNTKYHNNRTQY